MEAVGQLTAGIAHNFNNLLQGILANLEQLQLHCEEAVLVSESSQAAMRAAALVRELMVFSRRDHPGRRVEADAGDLVRSAVALSRATFDAASICSRRLTRAREPLSAKRSR